MADAVVGWLGVALVCFAVSVLLVPQPASGSSTDTLAVTHVAHPSLQLHAAPVLAARPALRLSSGPEASQFNLTVITRPSRCTVEVSGAYYSNGTLNSSMTPGYHLIQAQLCFNEAFVSWSSTAGTLNSTTQISATLDVESNGTLTATYAYGYNVTFNETGLVLGTPWTVTLSGNPETQSINQIVFGAANGTYSYSITLVPDYVAKYSGTLSVSGAPVTVQVKFTSILYTTTFQEVGLPAETQWSVTFNGTRDFSLSPALSFAEVNGSYSFTIWSVSGYSANRTSGSVTVGGHNQTVLLRFSQTTPSSSFPAWETYTLVGGVPAAIAVIGAGVYLVNRRKTPPVS